MERRNLALLTDFYELTMMNGYFTCGIGRKQAVFDLFYRGQGGFSYAVAAGLEQIVEYIKALKFGEDEIEYLASLRVFGEEFLNMLRGFKFSGDIYALPEGTLFFPYEPAIVVKAPLIEAQLIETALLNIFNHQTLIATKAARLKQVTSAAISEFGLRRAQGPDAGIYGARAAYIGGCRSTSNVLAAKKFGIPVKGTHAHSWVMSFPDELSAFRAYAEIYPHACLLLVDTYDTLKSGVPNAIKVFDEMKAKGLKPLGIRLDSGDLAYLSKRARVMLDEAGHSDVLIFASSDLDEDIIASLQLQNAQIDVYGVGTKLITSYTNASLGGVYKLAAIEENGKLSPKIKISNTSAKNTNPGFKKLMRIYDESGRAAADLITLFEERYDTSKPLTIFHPEEVWKKTTFENYTMKNLLVKVFENGELIYKLPSLKEIGARCDESMAEFYPEYKRTVNPHEYKVDLSVKLHSLRNSLLHG
ncbi:MAG TPA: nicotinate phosphoribosyltransferase [Eubacteriales bacterium]|jgi:nicotinate phosphoribosyltransferase|nr:nicotinate phosphoribosyltransferase [Clostridia bacterium]HRR89500.1 nicotinate phosphoribosyltransferase [Eubacteriales bacterium]HRU85008.1 nicotinate phosphoribosyltransferase [Eubacteriales bacterium]